MIKWAWGVGFTKRKNTLMLIWNIYLICCFSVDSHPHHWFQNNCTSSNLCRNNISFKRLFHIVWCDDFHKLFRVFTITKLHTHNCNWPKPNIRYTVPPIPTKLPGILPKSRKLVKTEQALACSVLITNNQTPTVSWCPSRYPTMSLTLGHSNITQFGAQPISKTLNRNLWVSKLRS